jgi:uncharacterized repeat protein (TIGR01451 family)
VVVASLVAIAVADTSALAERPYRNHVLTVPAIVYTSMTASTTAAFPGDEVDFDVAVENPTPDSAYGVLLEIEIPAGMQLLGAPAFERGSGCIGMSQLTCNLDFLLARQTTNVRFATRVLPDAGSEEKVVAWASTEGVADRHASVTVVTGSS